MSHSPTSVPYRANIDALKRLGVTDVISVSACGSFREDMAPGDFVIVDQFIDRTFAREKSFFGTGLRRPCLGRASDLPAARRRLRRRRRGPRASRCTTAAPIWRWRGRSSRPSPNRRLYREQWGCDVIGMTNMPEAKLAREAELCYASRGDDHRLRLLAPRPWRGATSPRSSRTLTGNADKARALVARLPALLGADRPPCPHGCDRALEFALMTAPETRDPALLARLDAVAGRVLG